MANKTQGGKSAMKCKIFGNFWRKDIDIHKGYGYPTGGMTPFAGEIEVKEDGSFTGVTNDYYGDAEIRGSLSGVALQFEKKYTRVSFGKSAGTGLQYLLRGCAINSIHGGWWGTYKQDGEEEYTPVGQATCTIHPDPNGE